MSQRWDTAIGAPYHIQYFFHKSPDKNLKKRGDSFMPKPHRIQFYIWQRQLLITKPVSVFWMLLMDCAWNWLFLRVIVLGLVLFCWCKWEMNVWLSCENIVYVNLKVIVCSAFFFLHYESVYHWKYLNFIWINWYLNILFDLCLISL